MRIIDPKLTTPQYKKIIQKYGGEYSIWEKIKMGGVGSPKVKYISGLEEFDRIHYTNDMERSFSNFGLFKNGFMIRINKKQQLGIAIEFLSELKFIRLEGNRGIVQFKDQTPFRFEFADTASKEVLGFFQKKELVNYLTTL